MERMGFCSLLINWIMACITIVKLCILDNGDEIDQIIPEQGLRQGVLVP